MNSKTRQWNSPNQSRKKKNEKSENSLKDFGDNIKQNNIRITGLHKGKERKGQKTSLTWGQKDIQLQEAQTVPKKMNPKRHTARHIIFKVSKLKIREEP